MYKPFENLNAKFTEGISWNGLFYVLHKILSMSLSLLLFKILSTEHFSLWANSNSLVFLTLLWADFGFRKSLPRYLPEFAFSPKALQRFTKSIILFQGSILISAIPIVLYLQHRMHPEAPSSMFYSCSIMLTTEGSVALLRLIFHSHFWIKHYNIIATIAAVTETIMCYLIIMAGIRKYRLVEYIMFAKIGSGLMIVVIACIALWYRYKKYSHTNNTKPINYKKLQYKFINHSAMMWGSNVLKSLTERNVMVPLLTMAFGAESANIYKIANDGALLLYRTVIKTIGTTDTVLFSHVEQLHDAKKLMPIAFTKVMTSIAALCLPLSGIIALASVFYHNMFSDECVFQLFFILVLGYLIESLLSPYERILEIKRRYVQLAIAYSPYAIAIVTIFYLNLVTLIGLIQFILLIQVVRLVSSILMIPYAYREYTLQFPVRYMTTLFMICLPIWLSLSMGMWWYVGIYQ